MTTIPDLNELRRIAEAAQPSAGGDHTAAQRIVAVSIDLIDELEAARAVIADLEALIPKWREARAYNADMFTSGGIGMMREIDYHGDVERIIVAYKGGKTDE